MLTNQHHHIRSFVHRSRELTFKRQQIVDELGQQYLLKTQNDIVDFVKIFGRRAPIILEIGFGMGDALWSMIKKYPNYDFIGIEVYKPGIARLLTLIKNEQNEQKNIRLYHADAITVLTQCIPNNSISQLLLLFPDPWPKKRHHKRRLIQPSFVQLMHEKLITGGFFHLITDCQDYAEHSRKILLTKKDENEIEKDGIKKDEMKSSSWRNIKDRYNQNISNTNNTDLDIDIDIKIDTDINTKFAKRAKQAGHAIWELTVAKE